MRRTGLIFLFCILILVFNSCQKENYENINVKLEVDQPVSVSSTNWIISGRILSSGKLNFKDHGFQVMVDGQFQNYSLGELNKSGKVEMMVEASASSSVSNVIFYAISQNGTTYSTDTLTPVSVTYPDHTSDTFADFFNSTILNSNTVDYAVTGYRLEYRLLGSSDPWTEVPYATAYYTTPTVPVQMGLPFNMSLFVNGNSYEYRVKVIYLRIADVMYFTTYSGVNSFVAVQ